MVTLLEKIMLTTKRTPLDLMDDIYSLAYWLTGSEFEATELVNNTYLNVDNNSSDTEVFKALRLCYFESTASDDESGLPETPCFLEQTLEQSLMKQFADIRLTVLLSAIPRLKHNTISTIIGRPLDTIRVWLSEGRKSMVQGIFFNSKIN